MINFKDRINKMISRMKGSKIKTQNKENLNNYIIKKKNNNNIKNNTNNLFINENLKTPIKYNCDVLVVGGGPSGLSAAIGSSRAGANTMLVERYGCFGGVITTVGMETIGWYRYEGTVDSEGIGIEMEKMAQKWEHQENGLIIIVIVLMPKILK